MIYSAAFQIGQTFQGVKDIWINGEALYQHIDLEEGKVKALTGEQIFKLQIFQKTLLSSLFIFRDYSFELDHLELKTRVRILPIVENRSSLVSIFIQESLIRIAKGIAALAVSCLIFPIWGLILTGSYLYNSEISSQIVDGWNGGIKESYQSRVGDLKWIPLEKGSSHFNRKDILRIGKALLGYRHVSTEEEALREAQNGIKLGCSLNLSFCKSENDIKARFEDLHLQVAAGKDCHSLIQDYENAITEFICSSIKMDIPNIETYEDVFDSLDCTRFIVVKTRWSRAADIGNYWQLGRFPKENVDSSRLILLDRIKKEDLGLLKLQGRRGISSLQERDKLIRYLASLYREKLLSYLREKHSVSMQMDNTE